MALLAQTLRPAGKNDITSCLLQDLIEEWQEAGINDNLDPVHPSPIQARLDGSRMKGLKAMPTALVMPTMDVGKLRSLSPFQMSVVVPPTMLIATEDAPPPKKRVTRIVAKFWAAPEGTRNMRKMTYNAYQRQDSR